MRKLDYVGDEFLDEVWHATARAPRRFPGDHTYVFGLDVLGCGYASLHGDDILGADAASDIATGNKAIALGEKLGKRRSRLGRGLANAGRKLVASAQKKGDAVKKAVAAKAQAAKEKADKAATSKATQAKLQEAKSTFAKRGAGSAGEGGTAKSVPATTTAKSTPATITAKMTPATSTAARVAPAASARTTTATTARSVMSRASPATLRTMLRGLAAGEGITQSSFRTGVQVAAPTPGSGTPVKPKKSLAELIETGGLTTYVNPLGFTVNAFIELGLISEDLLATVDKLNASGQSQLAAGGVAIIDEIENREWEVNENSEIIEDYNKSLPSEVNKIKKKAETWKASLTTQGVDPATGQTAATGTTLTADPGAAGTTLKVTSTAGFPSSGALAVDSEVIFYAVLTPTSFIGCVRGQLGTTAAAHPVGTPITPVEADPSLVTQSGPEAFDPGTAGSGGGGGGYSDSEPGYASEEGYDPRFDEAEEVTDPRFDQATEEGYAPAGGGGGGGEAPEVRAAAHARELLDDADTGNFDEASFEEEGLVDETEAESMEEEEILEEPAEESEVETDAVEEIEGAGQAGMYDALYESLAKDAGGIINAAEGKKTEKRNIAADILNPLNLITAAIEAGGSPEEALARYGLGGLTNAQKEAIRKAAEDARYAELREQNRIINAPSLKIDPTTMKRLELADKKMAALRRRKQELDASAAALAAQESATVLGSVYSAGLDVLGCGVKGGY